jgi:hypothetical protein
LGRVDFGTFFQKIKLFGKKKITSRDGKLRALATSAKLLKEIGRFYYKKKSKHRLFPSKKTRIVFKTKFIGFDVPGIPVGATGIPAQFFGHGREKKCIKKEQKNRILL